MYFEFDLDASDIDLWDVYLLDTDLDLLDPDIRSKHFVCVHMVCLQAMSSRRLKDISWRRLEDVFSVTIFRPPRKFSRYFARYLQDVFKTPPRCLQDIFKTSLKMKNCYAEDVLKICTLSTMISKINCLITHLMLFVNSL